jgi:hypothetical protein
MSDHQVIKVGCASCGRESQWIIAADIYGSSTMGRLMPYCTDCRREKIDGVLTSVPLSLIEQVPESTLLALYEIGAFGSDPASVREMFFPDLSDSWVQLASQALQSHDFKPSSPPD